MINRIENNCVQRENRRTAGLKIAEVLNRDKPSGKLAKIGSMPELAVAEITEITWYNGRQLGDYTEDVVTALAEKFGVTTSSVIGVSSTVEARLFPNQHDGKAYFEKYIPCIIKSLEKVTL